MATFTERLQLLIDANTRGAVAGIHQVDNAVEGVGGPQGRLARMRTTAQGAFSAMTGGAELTTGALKGAAVAAGAVAAVKLGKFAKDAADEWAGLAAQVRDFQRASGASAEDASRWVAALDDMEVSAEAGARAAFKMSREIGEGGKAIAQYGIEVARNRDGTVNLSETLLNVSDAYKGMSDQGERAALIQAVFGRAGKELLPILEKGRKGIREFFEGAEEGRQIFSQDDLDRAREYELALDDLSDTMRGLKLAVGGAVAPVIAKFAESFSEVVEGADEATASIGGLGGVLSTGFDLSPTSNTMHGLASITELAQGNLGAFAEEAVQAIPGIGNLASAVGIFGDETETYADKQKAANEATEHLADLAAQGKKGTKEYADAQRDARAASDELDASTRKVVTALRDKSTEQYNAMLADMGASAAALDLAAKQRGVADAIDAYAVAVLEGQHATESAEQYNRRLAAANDAVTAAALAYIQAAGAKAVADAGNASASDKAKAAVDAQEQAIIDLATSTPGATEAIRDLGYEVTVLPSGKVIVVDADTEPARRKLKDLGDEIRANVSAWQRAYYTGFGGGGGGGGRGVPAPAGLHAPAPVGVARGAPEALPVPAAGGAPMGGGVRPVAAALHLTVNITAGGLGADAPEIQRAVVAALRGYVNRNGPLPELAA